MVRCSSSSAPSFCGRGAMMPRGDILLLAVPCSFEGLTLVCRRDAGPRHGDFPAIISTLPEFQYSEWAFNWSCNYAMYDILRRLAAFTLAHHLLCWDLGWPRWLSWIAQTLQTLLNLCAYSCVVGRAVEIDEKLLIHLLLRGRSHVSRSKLMARHETIDHRLPSVH